jgi:hypothetical protein
MFLRLLTITALPWLALATASQAAAAVPPDAPVCAPSAPPTLSARRLSRVPQVDGIVIEDPAWALVPAAEGFWQTKPHEGRPSSEKTSVRIGFSEDTLYIGAVLYDSSPRDIIVSGARRDAALEHSDAILVVFDTFADRQNGLVFGTNPAGIEYDGQVAQEGGERRGAGSGQFGAGQMRGSGSGFNLNWDASWQVKTHTGAFGWSAEFAIPLKNLRYGATGPQTWGVNFQRNIARRNEVAYWAPVPRQFNLLRVSVAGTLAALDLPAQRNLKLLPYVLRQLQLNPDVTGDEYRWRSAGGVDLKYSVTPSLTLDATIGTDFSQVEVDEQQINLNRFNLFFPEKRPFFLENAGLFTVGEPNEIELFFSRRIGIGPAGQVIPMAGGARLSGKLGRLQVGLMDTQAEEVAGITPANNFGVARLNWELPNRSSIGGLFTSRAVTAGDDKGQPWHRTYAADGRWGIGRYGLVSGFVAQTDEPTDEPAPDASDDLAMHIQGTYDSPVWRVFAGGTRVGEDFDPELGFLQRTSAYWKATGLVLMRYRPRNFLGLHEVRPHVHYYGYYRPEDGQEETRFIHVDNHWEMRNGYEWHTGVNFTREGIFKPFEIHPGVFVPVGTYDHVESQLWFLTDPSAPVQLVVRSFIGGYFGGSRIAVSPHLRLRAGDKFSSYVGWGHNTITLPAGSFVTNLVVGRVSYSFTPHLFVQGLVQYNDSLNIWSTNLRLGWLQTANAGLFVVYSDNLDTMEGVRSLYVKNRSLLVKLSLQVDVL